MALEKVCVLLALQLAAACYDSSRGNYNLPDADGDPAADSTQDADADPDMDILDLPDDDAFNPLPDGMVPDYGGLDSFWDLGPDVNPECPPPSDIETSFVIDGVEAPDSPIDLMAPCAVAGLTMPTPASITLTLTCTGDEGPSTHTIEMTSFPPLRIELATGTDIMFEYKAAPSSSPQPWTNRWFVIYSLDGSLLLSGTDAETAWPPGETGTIWFSPLIPYVDEDGCAGGTQECFTYQRLSMSFEWRTGEYVGTDIWDRGEAWLGYGATYHLRMGEATRRTGIVCPDEPETWYSLIITFDASG